jgi:putative transposase
VKKSPLVDERGVPLSIVVTAANVHDVKLLVDTLDGIVIERPEPTEENPQNLCLDAGYKGIDHAASVAARGYILHLQSRNEEAIEIEHNPEFKARRWVVEVFHSWLNRFRKLLVRFEKKIDNFLALIQFACAIITWRKVLWVHKGYPNY